MHIDYAQKYTLQIMRPCMRIKFADCINHSFKNTLAWTYIFRHVCVHM